VDPRKVDYFLGRPPRSRRQEGVEVTNRSAE